MSDLVGKRMLLKVGKAGAWGRDAEVQEFKILELSPSGNWIKLMNAYGNKFWKPVADVAVVEELKPLKVDRPPDSAGASK